MTALTVLIMPVLCPAARRMLNSRLVVVVLPSVPVMPTIFILREGKPCHAAQSRAKARRAFGT